MSRDDVKYGNYVATLVSPNAAGLQWPTQSPPVRNPLERHYGAARKWLRSFFLSGADLFARALVNVLISIVSKWIRNGFFL